MTEYKQQVAQQAGCVLHDAQQRMQQVQQQQQQVLASAESYLNDLLAKRDGIASKAQAERAHQQLQQLWQLQQQMLQQQQTGVQPALEQQHAVDLLADETLLPPEPQQQQQQPAMSIVASSAPECTGESAPASARRTLPLDQLKNAVQQLLQRPASKKHDRQGSSASSRSRPHTDSVALDPQAKRQKLQPAAPGVAAAAAVS